MKKVLWTFIALAFVGSLCFAQQPIAPATPAVTETVKTFVGKVETVTPTMGKPPLWVYCRIVVTSDTGDKDSFYVMKTTAITDVDGKNVSGSAVKRGKKVEVKSSIITNGSAITNGKNGAVSIHYLD